MTKKEEDLLPWPSECGLCHHELTTWTEFHFHAKNGCTPREIKDEDQAVEMSEL